MTRSTLTHRLDALRPGTPVMTNQTLPVATTEAAGIETRQVFDPFQGKTVDISHNLVDRLEGKYAIGPITPNGEPEFGWRQHDTTPICREAAQRIRAMQAERDDLVKALEGARHHINAALSLNEENRLSLAVQGRSMLRSIDAALTAARSKAQGG